jgi:hypothetical protein
MGTENITARIFSVSIFRPKKEQPTATTDDSERRNYGGQGYTGYTEVTEGSAMSGGDDGASIVRHSRSIGPEHLENSGRTSVSGGRGSLRSPDNYRKGRSLGILFTASVW